MIRLTGGTVFLGLVFVAVALLSRGCAEEKPVGPPPPLRLAQAYMSKDQTVRPGVGADIYVCFDRGLTDQDWKGGIDDSWWGLTYILETKQGYKSEHDDTPRALNSSLMKFLRICYWLTSEHSLHPMGTRWVTEEERILRRGAVELRVWLWWREYSRWTVVDSARYGL